MLNNKRPEDVSFYGVALLVISVGIVILGVGAASWLLNFFFGYHLVFPSVKIMGGVAILALGYIVLLLELLRKKN